MGVSTGLMHNQSLDSILDKAIKDHIFIRDAAGFYSLILYRSLSRME